MSKLRDQIKFHSYKNHRQLKALCAPLLDCLSIPFFCHYRIEENGRFLSLTNLPEFVHFYFTEKKHLLNPYFSHPSFFRSGYTITPPAFDSETLKIFHDQFNLHYFFIILQKQEMNLDAFIFADNNPDPSRTSEFISQVDLLNKFASYFKQKAKPIISEVLGVNYNMREERKDSFLTSDTSIPLFSQKSNMTQFLKAIAPLSPQENRCLELYKEGHSAQATGSILGLSSRTVEFYFESIKAKLDCTSKRELLHW